jgi:hypothetical protein
LEIDDNAFFIQSTSGYGNLYLPVVTMEFFAFAMEGAQSMGSGEMGSDSDFKHEKFLS